LACVGRERPFAHPVKAEFASIFDELGIAWEYEPHTFVLARRPDGAIAEAFTPDFYLPEQDMYVECTTMRQRHTTRKNGKVRRLRARGTPVAVVYRRDFRAAPPAAPPVHNARTYVRA
jgi:hypoxanthine phosphoribosyltransferase